MPDNFTDVDVAVAQENLLGLRDNAMFDKLKHAYHIVPKNQKEAQDLLALADQEEALLGAGLPTEGPSRFGSLVKQGTDDLRSRGVIASHDDRTTIENLAAKIADDEPDFVTSALCLTLAAADGEEG